MHLFFPQFVHQVAHESITDIIAHTRGYLHALIPMPEKGLDLFQRSSSENIEDVRFTLDAGVQSRPCKE